MTAETFLQQIVAEPETAAQTWLVLADWLEEQGDPRPEIVRLCPDDAHPPDLTMRERDLLAIRRIGEGLDPVVPTLTNSLGMTFAWIPAGTFQMGSPEDEEDRYREPLHEVTLTRPYFLGVHAVT